MALTSTEESLVRDLIAQNAALLALAGNEANITTKLGATQVTLSDLTSATDAAGDDLLLIRQGVEDKSVTRDVLRSSLLKGALKALDALTPAANTVPYFTNASTADLAPLTTFARSLLDDPDAENARTTLGLGALAVLSAIHGGLWNGSDLAIVDGGTGASTASAARNNLDVYSRLEADASGQPGDIKWTARNTSPPGWLKANGAAHSRSVYVNLFSAIGTTFGAGDGSSTFNVPDLRGTFIRGWDDGRGMDPDRIFGSFQDSQNGAHNHSGTTTISGGHSHTTALKRDRGYNTTGVNAVYGDEEYEGVDNVPSNTAGAHNHTFTTGASGGSEARPRNVALLPCIRF